MINRKIRTRKETNKKYIDFLLSQGVKPLNHYISKGKEVYIFDNQTTQIYRIAFQALKEKKRIEAKDNVVTSKQKEY